MPKVRAHFGFCCMLRPCKYVHAVVWIVEVRMCWTQLDQYRRMRAQHNIQWTILNCSDHLLKSTEPIDPGETRPHFWVCCHHSAAATTQELPPPSSCQHSAAATTQQLPPLRCIVAHCRAKARVGEEGKARQGLHDLRAFGCP